MAQPSPAPAKVTVLVETLANVATGYPDAAVQKRAGDATRVIAGRALPNAAFTEASVLVRAVAQLVKQDELLGRDAQRFLDPWRPKPMPWTLGTASSSGNKLGPPPQLVREFKLKGELTGEVEWRSAIAVAGSIVAVGNRGDALILIRSNWTGAPQQSSKCAKLRSQAGYLLGVIKAHEQTHQLLILSVSESRSLSIKGMSPNAYFTEGLSIGAPWMPPNLAGFCVDGSMVHTLTRDPELQHNVYDAATGNLLSSGPITTLFERRIYLEFRAQAMQMEMGLQPIHMVVRDEHQFFAAGSQLLRISYGNKVQVMDLPSPVLEMTASEPLTRFRVVLGCEEGGVIAWPEGGSTRFGEGMSTPRVCLTRSGMLVAAGSGELRVYRVQGNRVELHAKAPLPAPHPVTLLPSLVMNEFLALSPNGQARVYRVV